MSEDNSEMEEQLLWRWCTAFLLLAMVALISWIFYRTYFQKHDRIDDVDKMPKSHPVFGPILLTEAIDPIEMPKLRDMRGNEMPNLNRVNLTLGTNAVQWWIGESERDRQDFGYLYVWGLFPGPTNMWSVAPCSKHDLADVTVQDLDSTFVPITDDEDGEALFKTNWISSGRTKGAGVHALRVQEGDIILMHPPDASSTTYVLEITRQKRGVLRARYLVIQK